jgi:hypothetical protein
LSGACPCNGHFRKRIENFDHESGHDARGKNRQMKEFKPVLSSADIFSL